MYLVQDYIFSQKSKDLVDTFTRRFNKKDFFLQKNSVK